MYHDQGLIPFKTIAVGEGVNYTAGLPDKMVFLFNTKDYKMPKGLTFEYEKGNTKKQEALKNKKGKVEVSYSNYIINKGINDKIFAEK